MNIEEQVKTIVANISDVNVQEITLHSSIGDFPKWDSMGQMAILQKTEETFDITFEPEEMMDIEDVNDIINAVKSKL